MGFELEWQFITKALVFIINTVGTGLILIVFLGNPRAKLNRIFVLMTLLMFVWVDFAFLARLNGQAERALLWIRIAWAITPLLFALIYFFIINFIKGCKECKLLDSFNIFLGILFIFGTLFTDFVIRDISFTGEVPMIIYGQLVFLFFGVIFYFTILNFVLLFKKYFKSKNLDEKIKIKLLLIGLFFFFLMNSIFNIALPVFFKVVHLYEFGDYSTIFFLSIIAYAIVKRELFGIKIIATASLVSVMVLLLGLDIFVFTSQLIIQLIKGGALILFLYFGYLLIRSVMREIEMKKKVERAYELEKKARAEIEEITEAKTQFIMATQHHLRTPLTSMAGYVDLIFGGSYGKVPKKNEESSNEVSGFYKEIN